MKNGLTGIESSSCDHSAENVELNFSTHKKNLLHCTLWMFIVFFHKQKSSIRHLEITEAQQNM